MTSFIREYTLVAAVLLLLVPNGAASQQLEPISFVPSAPTASNEISISFQKSACVLIEDLPNQIDVVRNSSVVDVIIDGTIAFEPILCVFTPGRVTFQIGRLPPGTYSVRAIIRDSLPPFTLYPPIASGGIAVAAAGVDGLTKWASIALCILIVLLGRDRVRSPQSRVVIAMVIAIPFIMPTARAQEAQSKSLYLLISTESGAPAPEAVVEQYDFSTGRNPPFRALLVGPATGAGYLLPNRATGAFRDYLMANGDRARSMLERYIVVNYAANVDLQSALAAWRAEPYVVSVSVPLDYGIPTAAAIDATAARIAPALPTTFDQSWINAMQFPAAWSQAGGWGLVGLLDSGAYIDHSDLKATTPSNGLTGGNLLQAYALDNGRYTGQPYPLQTGIIDFNVDEREPRAVPPLSTCDPDGNGQMQTSIAGHGTHTAGLAAANATNGDGVLGACRSCGLALVKITQDVCEANPGPFTVAPSINSIAIQQGMTYLIDNGVQVVNASFGSLFALTGTNCAVLPWIPECVVLTHASDRGVLIVASSGNSKVTINFPARDPRVVAVGGLIEDGTTFWSDRLDLPPSELTGGCPALIGVPPPAECGSNFSQTTTEPKQGLVAQARNVSSLAYPGYDWNVPLRCGDSFGTAVGDGKGLCTGTSMSAPLVSGLAGILRSVNPLPPIGDPETVGDPVGLRDVLIAGGILSGTVAWDQRLGYGRLNAAGSVRASLGASGGVTVVNRLTPLFALYSTGATDWAYTTVPQVATALMVSGLAGSQGLIDGFPNNGDWRPSGTLVGGYPAFPGGGLPGVPRSDAFVLTTEHRVSASHPSLVPLYWLDRKRNLPVGCAPGPGCDSLNRDYLLMTSAAEVTTALNDGYTYRGIQGYVYQRCVPEPSCVPMGAQRMYRQCNVALDDCAVFLEGQKPAFEAQGYVAAYPTGTITTIGYAYPNVDADVDLVIDGQELLLGSKLNSPDSDADGHCDAVEYPLAGFPTTDICSDGRCSTGYIFSGGFESLGSCTQ